ncbi:hypothetical protein [Paenibacillus sp. RUD330]|uniref:hypothetical protein n=1 Tax=Paenibacillus sp. RUD330 TaxID=2023772 RepID=UPI000955373C|nr:hypothetical protein [Paenibacillus sp. RUD330]QID16092.1 hypothetical protein CIC07_25555 [Paenibacillus sp. RUD330]SIP99167.1 hypothetical protein SAMN05880555_0238 [Paenibacillus sp. RU4X]SIQ18152.1 hypothetical protein SAMN05880570_0238 [Paenibacillus sp. RU4T]
MLCPVCNGIRLLDAACPLCAGPAEDCGPAADYAGPYSPYSPVQTEDLSSGLEQACYHMVYCPACSSSCGVSVRIEL